MVSAVITSSANSRSQTACRSDGETGSASVALYSERGSPCLTSMLLHFKLAAFLTKCEPVVQSGLIPNKSSNAASDYIEV